MSQSILFRLFTYKMTESIPDLAREISMFPTCRGFVIPTHRLFDRYLQVPAFTHYGNVIKRSYYLHRHMSRV